MVEFRMSQEDEIMDCHNAFDTAFMDTEREFTRKTVE
jgi:hypothetical protein